MSATLLQTKLFIPQQRPNLVARPHLFERLNAGLRQGRRLTLVAAPAGFGKTTLVSTWVRTSDRAAAWLSLDEADGDPTRFLAYFVAALQSILPGMGEDQLAALQSRQPPPPEIALTALLNDISARNRPFIVVFDDYHQVDNPAVDTLLQLMLQHLPPAMHVAILSREDPDLPLARWRVRDWITELRVADLRFSHAEAAGFLQSVMGLDLSTEDIAVLERRTEGWVAGLQLAALTMQGRDDVSGFIRTFAGDNRYIIDYLAEEVLARQSAAVRRFLLATSILDRLCGPLCDAVTGQADGSKTLDMLERANLFVVPLDDQRNWYRYHQLFAEVLRAHVLEEGTEDVADLHRRASVWFETHDLPGEAVRHALAARDEERAADLLEWAWQDMNRTYQSARLRRWLERLPATVVSNRPVLTMALAWALLSDGELEAAGDRLDDAERWLDMEPASRAGMIVRDEAQFRALPATIASARAYIAQALGDVEAAVRYSQRALELLPADEPFERGVASVLLGLAQWETGDLAAAESTFAAGLDRMRDAGQTVAAISGTFVLAAILLAEGRLREAIQLYEQTLREAVSSGDPALRGTADLHLGLSDLLFEQGEFAAADNHLRLSESLGHEAALPPMQYRSRPVVLARMKRVQGDWEAALALLDEAERLYVRGPVPDLRPVAAMKARIWAAAGRLDKAGAWARATEIADEPLAYRREYEHLTLVRVLLARYRVEQDEEALSRALVLLDQLATEAEAGGRWPAVIECLILRALTGHARRDPAWEPALSRALALAEDRGYVALFLDEGRPLHDLLIEAEAGGLTSQYAARLLAAFDALAGPGTALETARAPAPVGLVEPLSERELEILCLLDEGLSNREIGQRLHLAVSTVKGHNGNIYGKLNVRRRTEALARARELGLI